MGWLFCRQLSKNVVPRRNNAFARVCITMSQIFDDTYSFNKNQKIFIWSDRVLSRLLSSSILFSQKGSFYLFFFSFSIYECSFPLSKIFSQVFYFRSLFISYFSRYRGISITTLPALIFGYFGAVKCKLEIFGYRTV